MDQLLGLDLGPLIIRFHKLRLFLLLELRAGRSHHPVQIAPQVDGLLVLLVSRGLLLLLDGEDLRLLVFKFHLGLGV